MAEWLIVDASCLYEVVTLGSLALRIQERVAADSVAAAPHIVDVEVMSVIRREFLRGLLDESHAFLATRNLREWPGERFGHRFLLDRAWQLRHSVRGWDAFYIALAELFDATLITLDGRLSRAPGLRCPVEVIS